MITFNNEKELLNYLMTSDFEVDNITPKEAKYLLNKFRYYYRIEHSKQMSKEFEISRLNDKISSLENSLIILNREVDITEFRYERIKNKKLSFKERLKGKIQE